MNVLYDANRVCVACPMRKECLGPVPAEGPMNAEIALIGEAPGRNEDRLGRPWMGAAGQFLTSLLESVGLKREDILLSNMSKCRPKGNRTPTTEEAKFCADRWLSVELNMVKPKIIGLLGDVAISYFLGEGTVYERHGIPVSRRDKGSEQASQGGMEGGPGDSGSTIHSLNGKGSHGGGEGYMGGGSEYIILPMYHPAAGLYDKGEGMLAQILEDFQVLGELARGTWKPVVDEYPDPIYSDGDYLFKGQRLALDTEWVDNKLWSVQLSSVAAPGTAVFVGMNKWGENGLSLNHPVIKGQEIIVHSYMADAKMVDLPPNTKDTMVMAYLLGLPQGLKELAKKLCGMTMQSYQEVTRHYGKDKAMAYLEEAALGRKIRTEGYVGGTVQDWSSAQVRERILAELERGVDGLVSVPDSNVPDSLEEREEWPVPPILEEAVKGVRNGTRGKAIDNKDNSRQVVESPNTSSEATGDRESSIASETAGVSYEEWPDPPVLEDAVWNKKNSRFEIKSKTPQHISKKIKRILADVNGGKVNKDGPVDPRDRWLKIDERERTVVESILGAISEGSLDDAPLGDAIYYSSRDADATGRIEPILWQQILDKGLLPVFMMDMETLPIALEMEKNGIKIDVQKLRDLGDRFVGMLQEKSEEIFKELNILCPECAGVGDMFGDGQCKVCQNTHIKRFNPNSNQELATLFFSDLGFTPTKYTKKGFPSVARGELAKIDHPIVIKIEDYRHIQHLKDSFCDTLPEEVDSNNRIHEEIKTTRTATGRWSMKRLQTIPVRTDLGREIREAFIPEEGNALVSIDYSQIEMRVQAHVAQCESMIQIFREGRHIHRETCAEIYDIPLLDIDQDGPEYKATKNIGFGVMFLETEEGLYTQMKREKAEGWDLARCRAFIKDWYRLRPEVWSWQQETMAFARRNGYIKDIWGRIRKIPECLVPVEWVQSQGDRQAVNMPIQGGAQGILKQAMVKLWSRQHTKNFRWLLQVHDEILIETPEPDSFIKWAVPIMENAVHLQVPVICESKTGTNWGDMQKWKK